jgi:hypothetical protein
VFERRTIKQLARDHDKSANWVRKQLENYELPKKTITPCQTVIVADATYFRRQYGILVLRADKIKRNIFWREIDYERIDSYLRARRKIESQGFKALAIVTDGRPGVRGIFEDVPVQMCHFHQKQIITRHLTTRPVLPAGIELRNISQTLCNTTEEEFTNALEVWYLRWCDFLKEKTFNPETGKSFYTHHRIRSAHYSLKTNLDYLFIYQKYSELNIPNTTSSLEGAFSHLKDLTKLHRGLNYKTKRKMIDTILSK